MDWHPLQLSHQNLKENDKKSLVRLIVDFPTCKLEPVTIFFSFP